MLNRVHLYAAQSQNLYPTLQSDYSLRRSLERQESRDHRGGLGPPGGLGLGGGGGFGPGGPPLIPIGSSIVVFNSVV